MVGPWETQQECGEIFRHWSSDAYSGSAVAAGSSSGGSGPPGGSASAVSEPLGAATPAGRTARPEESGTGWAQTASASGRSEAYRARAEAWAASSGLRNQFVDLVARGPSDRRGMRSPLPCLASLAHSGAVGLELPASSGAGAGAGRRKDPAVEAEALAGD